MRKKLAVLMVLGLFVAFCNAATQQRPPVRSHADVQHLGNSARVLASESRPLNQAVTALVEEYGWAVDFEDPPYASKFDIIDNATPQWRAAHPDSKAGMIPAGGAFQTEYPEKPNTATSLTEERMVLNKVVADYNNSGNPGKFTVREEGNGRFAIVGEYIRDDQGKDKKTIPILDTPIYLPRATRSAVNTIELIFQELSAKTGVKAGPGGMPSNPRHPIVTVGGEEAPARKLLIEALSGYRVTLVWVFLYDTQSDTYAFSLQGALPAPKNELERKTMEKLKAPQR
jgi:hypothetical protein